MRKIVLQVLSTIIVAGVVGISAYAEDDITVYVNDIPIQQEGFLKDDSTYVPLRAVSEALGAEVVWDGDTRSVRISMSEDDLNTHIIDEVSPSVVAIVGNYKPQYMPGNISDYNEITAHGTGVIIKSAGIILTNAHVVEEIDNLTVVFADGSSSAGTVECMDKNSDLAIVKVNRLGLKPVNFGETEDISAGKSVIAIGTPLSLSMRNTATKGIISGVNVSMNNSYYPLIQTDAAINPGNSGGPLVNMEGKLIGINSSKYSGVGIEGMAFSIPLETVNYFLDQYEKNGRVIRPDLGIALENSWEAKIGLPTTKGVTVRSSNKDNIKSGDMIMSVNGKEVHSVVDYNSALRDTYDGQDINLGIVRNGERIEAAVTPDLG